MNLPPHLSVRNGHLVIGEHDCLFLAESYGTPLYVTDEIRIRDNYRRFREALSSYYREIRILYASKANGNLAILKILADEGAGADVFSSGELNLALRAGMIPEHLLFNGSSKSREDLALATETGIKVSVDSFDELSQLNAIAGDAGRVIDIAFRVNPALDVPTHPKIATGLATSKFGIPAGQIRSAYEEALSCSNVRPVGMHCHIGSQILAVEPFAKSADVMVKLAADLSDMGVELTFIDIGGGLGIPYNRRSDAAPTVEEYAEAVMTVFCEGMRETGLSPELWVEPGRYLVGDSTVLLTRSNSVKKTHKHFVNVDAGFNLLARPVLYDAYHEVVVANKVDEPVSGEFTITGPICETGDIIAHDRLLPAVEAGDVIAVLDAGAYGFSMSSQYNSRPRCPEVLLRGPDTALMRRGETVEDLLSTMQTPHWLKQ